MCTGNRAEDTTTWINKQLETLWYLASRCTEKRDPKDTNSEIIHSTCLAEFRVGHRFSAQSDNLRFYCAFKAPKIEFICNHDALLKFRLTEGYFKNHNETRREFNANTCAFRVPFRQHLITDTTYSSHGQTDVCKAKFLILDLNAAEVVRNKSTFAEGHGHNFEELNNIQNMIAKYLRTEYLPLLRRAGHHFIHALPDFDCLPRSHHIDWSMITKVDLEHVHVFNFNVEMVNAFLKTRWLEHCNFVDELEANHDHSRFGDFALAEHRGICDDFRFHGFFGPPQLQALCSKEAIFILDIRDLFIWTEGGFELPYTHQFSHWKIKIITDLQLVEEGRFKFEFSNARLCEDLCIFNVEEAVRHVFLKIKHMFFRYITRRYLRILEEYGHHHVRRIDVHVVEEDVYIGGGEEIDFEFSKEECMERLCVTDTCGFDIITAISQASINHHFRCLWKASKDCLLRIQEAGFNAEFGALQIQLPHDPNSKIVTLHITLQKVTFTLLDRFGKSVNDRKETFKDWRIAYEIEVGIQKSKDEHVHYERHLNKGSYVHQQLVLKFGTAKLSQKLSRLPGIFDSADYHDSRVRLRALRHHIGHYFDELQHHGHHVLYSFPVWNDSTSRFHPFAPTRVEFKFYGPSFGKDTSVIKHAGRRVHENRNMIVICGTFNTFNTNLLNSISPRTSWTWSSSQHVIPGVVVISREAFLRAWLLEELSHVNDRTTFTPSFQGIQDDDDWRFKLVTMEGREIKCGWSDKPLIDSSQITYIHTNTVTWTHTHSGDSRHGYNGGYTISCETSNKLSLPRMLTADGCEIKLSGKAVLDMAFAGDHGSWSAGIIAKWSYAIAIVKCSSGKGLHVSSKHFSVTIDDPGFTGHRDIIHPSIEDATKCFKDQFKRERLVEQTVIQKLKDTFSNVWPLFHSGSYSYAPRNPCFTETGDFILELDSLLDSNGRAITVGHGEKVISPLVHNVSLTTSALAANGNGHSPIKSPAPKYSDINKDGTKAFPTISDKEKKTVGNAKVDTPPVYAPAT